MYDVIERERFMDMVRWCRPICAVDVDVRTGRGEVIELSQVYEAADRSTQIRCYRDDLLLRYDVYYKKSLAEKMVRVLM